MEKEVEALKSAVVEHQRDAHAARRERAALRRENQQLRADAGMLLLAPARRSSPRGSSWRPRRRKNCAPRSRRGRPARAK